MTCSLLRRLGALALLAALALPAAAQTPLPITLPASVATNTSQVVYESIHDIDGDGVTDLVIAFPFKDAGGVTNSGQVFLFSGATGVQIGALTSPAPVPGGQFGTSVKAVPDANTGQGILLIGAPGETVNGLADAGRVYRIRGSNGFLLDTITSPTPRQSGAFGTSIATSPSGSTRPFIVGEPGGFSGPLVGQAHLFDQSPVSLIRTFVSPAAESSDRFGQSVALLRGGTTGRDQVLIGAPNETVSGLGVAGRTYEFDFFGTLDLTYLAPTPTASTFFGSNLFAVPDVTGDGRDEVLIGEEFSGSRVLLFDGRTGALIRAYSGSIASGPVPDIDGDGVADHLVQNQGLLDETVVYRRGDGTAAPHNRRYIGRTRRARHRRRRTRRRVCEDPPERLAFVPRRSGVGISRRSRRLASARLARSGAGERPALGHPHARRGWRRARAPTATRTSLPTPRRSPARAASALRRSRTSAPFPRRAAATPSTPLPTTTRSRLGRRAASPKRSPRTASRRANSTAPGR